MDEYACIHWAPWRDHPTCPLPRTFESEKPYPTAFFWHTHAVVLRTGNGTSIVIPEIALVNENQRQSISLLATDLPSITPSQWSLVWKVTAHCWKSISTQLRLHPVSMTSALSPRNPAASMEKCLRPWNGMQSANGPLEWLFANLWYTSYVIISTWSRVFVPHGPWLKFERCLLTFCRWSCCASSSLISTWKVFCQFH